MNQESDSKMIRLLCLMVGACLMAGCHFSPDRPTVVTSLGVVEGAFRNGAIEYRAIPYSQPLSAKDRWTSATTVQAWSGSLDAAAFGGACPQTARFELTEESLEENCLTLNVSVPTNASSKERLPVLVWLPGGGFVGGGSNLYRLDKLAREGRILVVSVNYRVGALGFMSHPSQKDQPWNGNVGLEDQRLALKWVQQHITQFGGDPQRVTLGGESA
jgi:para-nitrobenzyl esterase